MPAGACHTYSVATGHLMHIDMCLRRIKLGQHVFECLQCTVSEDKILFEAVYLIQE